jgi:hypothetical protein
MHNFLGLTNKFDNFRKGIFVDPYDEPTYLTFALDFRFDNTPEVEGGSEAALLNSPLFNEQSANSAIKYLMGRGFEPQANGMKTFKEILRYLTFQAPWYFQSVTGLSEMYKQATDQSKGYKTNGITLKVGTLEAIDLRIAELAGLYRNAIYDLKYRRERVPDNLRWFTVDIYIAEFRNMRARFPGVTQGAANALGIDTGATGNLGGNGNVLEQFGYIKFTCRQCEFDFSDTLPVSQKVEIGYSGKRQAEGNQFGIKVGWVEEEARYGDGTTVYDDPVKTDIRNPWGSKNLGTTAQNAGSFLTGLPIIGDDLQRAGQKALDGLSKVGGLLNPALQAASKFTEADTINEFLTGKKDLGDVYDSGYESNGDNVPPRRNPPSGNVYP